MQIAEGQQEQTTDDKPKDSPGSQAKSINQNGIKPRYSYAQLYFLIAAANCYAYYQPWLGANVDLVHSGPIFNGALIVDIALSFIMPLYTISVEVNRQCREGRARRQSLIGPLSDLLSRNTEVCLSVTVLGSE